MGVPISRPNSLPLVSTSEIAVFQAIIHNQFFFADSDSSRASEGRLKMFDFATAVCSIMRQ
jgi:hypothetical protein